MRDTNEPKSWGDAIKQYRRGKQLLEWDVTRVTKDFDSATPAMSNTVSTHLEREPSLSKESQVQTNARHPTYGSEGVVHRTRYTQARREAAYNPITGQHLDRAVEQGLRTKEKSDEVHKANKGQDRALATETNFNVTHLTFDHLAGYGL